MADKTADITRSHPWLTFELDLRRLPYVTWMQMGEAVSKTEHIANSLLEPSASEQFYKVWLVKGAQATAAIEGNTLTTEQVDARIEGELQLPKSAEYLGVEIDNVVKALKSVASGAIAAPDRLATPEAILRYHSLILSGLELDEHVVPGEFRKTNVGVANYRAPDWQHVPALMKRMCEWLNETSFVASAEHPLAFGILRAIMAHLYIAWIHPFGDGNGRTARLIEFGMLVQAGVPTPAAHVLSNHYNRTRSQYYRELKRASDSGGDVVPFIQYSLQGFVDGLTEQIKTIYDMQRLVLWRDYVYRRFGDDLNKAQKRQRLLVLEMSQLGREVAIESSLASHSPKIAVAYAGLSDRTLRRDLEALVKMKLLVKGDGGGVWVPGYELLHLLPARRTEKKAESH
jgi:Fic family protein